MLAYHSCSYSFFTPCEKKTHGSVSPKKRISIRNKRNGSFMASWKVDRGRTGTFLGSHLVQELSLERLGLRDGKRDMVEVECAGRHRYVYMIYIYIHICVYIETMHIYIYMHALCILHVYNLISTRQCTRSSVQNRQIPIVKKVHSLHMPHHMILIWAKSCRGWVDVSTPATRC